MWEFDLFGCCIGLFGLGLLTVVVAYAVLVVHKRAGKVMNNHEKKE